MSLRMIAPLFAAIAVVPPAVALADGAVPAPTKLPAYMTPEELHLKEMKSLDLPGAAGTELNEPPLAIPGMTPGGEFEHVDAVAFGWVSYGGTIDDMFASMGAALDGRAEVYFMVQSFFEPTARAMLANVGVDVDSPNTTVHLFRSSLDTVWLRDYGPIWVKNPLGRSIMVNPIYYGGDQRPNDDDIPYYLATKLDMPITSPTHDIEGGNFQANGNGLCIMSNWAIEENWYRYPGWTEADLVDVMTTYYGCSDVLVVQRMAREGTGHVDMWLAFIDEDHALVGQYDPGIDDENMAILDANAAVLDGYGLPGGGTLSVSRIPMPESDCLCGDGSMNCCVWRTYTNVVYVDSAVLVPTYRDNDPVREAAALSVWANEQPDRDIIPIDADEIIYLAGAIHCVSQTWSWGEPAPASSASCADGTATNCGPPADEFATVSDVPPLEKGCSVARVAGRTHAAGLLGLAALAALTLGGTLATRRRRAR
ncbi:MAG TPA: agmatine deiminase family protein [Myxococcota bacterium]|nr:agmatine deiminase family protein [Myxococcota bacterium]